MITNNRLTFKHNKKSDFCPQLPALKTYEEEIIS